MSLWRQVHRGIRVLFNRTGADRDVADEIRHFYDEAVAAHRARGLSVDDAHRKARREIGDARVVVEHVRDYGWENGLATLFSDLRLAFRMLRKSPVFTIVVVVVIALGSGAVTTMFSAMNALVLRPVPGVANPRRLVMLQPIRSDGLLVQQGSFNDYVVLRDHSGTLQSVGAWGKASLTIAGAREGTTVWGNLVSGSYFEVLGIRPALGRFFTAEEDQTPGSHPVIVVSYGFWKSKLGGDRGAIGGPVRVNGQPFTLIGVAPPEFRGIYTGLRAEAWVPLMMQPRLRPRANLTTSSWLWMFARLREEVTPEGARAEIAALMANRSRDTGQPHGPAGYRSMGVFAFSGLPAGEGQAVIVFMGVLFAGSALVLVIAGVNVSAMLSARAVARGRELAVRAALGAARSRLVRQLLTEILLLFAIGAAGGLAIAVLATSALERIPLPANLPLLLELSPDTRVLVFAIGTSAIAGLIFGLAPALRASKQNLTSSLGDGSRTTDPRRTFLNRTLVVAQLALSLTLLVAAGLFTRALAHGRAIDPGFDMAHVVTTQFEPESWGYHESGSRAFYSALRARVAGMPDVAAVSYVGRLPLTASSSTEDIEVEREKIGILVGSVDADYFSVLRMPIVQGRAFTSADSESSVRVAIVNMSLARRLARDRNVLGRSFGFLGKQTTIVGVVGDAKYATLDESTPLFAYFPLAQVWQPTQSLIIRTNRDVDWLGPAIQEVVLSMDPALPRPQVSSMTDATSIVLLPQRVAALVTSTLGGVGLLLAIVGLYGIMVYSVEGRTRELGVRMALGAPRASVLRMIIGEGMRLAGIAIVAGLILAGLTTSFIKAFLFTVSPFDAPTFAAMSILFLAVAFVASYLPARRAAAADPLAALRAE